MCGVCAVCSTTYASETRAGPYTRKEFMLATVLRKVIIPVHHSGPWPPAGISLHTAVMQHVPGGDGVPIAVVVAELVTALRAHKVKPELANGKMLVSDAALSDSGGLWHESCLLSVRCQVSSTGDTIILIFNNL